MNQKEILDEIRALGLMETLPEKEKAQEVVKSIIDAYHQNTSGDALFRNIKGIFNL